MTKVTFIVIGCVVLAAVAAATVWFFKYRDADFPYICNLRAWLRQNNGHGIEGVTIFPVMDERDPRMTWDSIDRRFRRGWAGWLDNFVDEQRDFTHLLPFADYGTGDYYCFDYSRLDSRDEPPVVRWSHETGDTDDRAASFPEFVTKVQAGEFDND